MPRSSPSRRWAQPSLRRGVSFSSRPRTNQIAWTGTSPTFASRCGVVESSEIASPGSRRYLAESDRDLERAGDDVAPLVPGVTLEGIGRDEAPPTS